MKIAKSSNSVWILENRDTIVGCDYSWKTRKAYAFFVETSDGIMEYTKDEMVEIYGLTGNDFANINRNQF